MHVSLSELTSTVAKASVAVGCDHGNADAISQLALFTSRYRLAPLETFANALTAVDEQSSRSFDPQAALDGEFMCSPDQPLSAISVIAPLRDTLLINHQRKSQNSVVVRLVDQPLLVGLAALHCSVIMSGSIEWRSAIDDRCLVNDQLLNTDALTEISALTRTTLSFRPLRGGIPTLPEAHSYGINIQEQLWETLNAFAKRLLVPATESSRLTGAGAGLLDQD